MIGPVLFGIAVAVYGMGMHVWGYRRGFRAASAVVRVLHRTTPAPPQPPTRNVRVIHVTHDEAS